jgi:hypothetical protein
VPYTASKTTKTESPVTIRLTGSIPAKAIKELALGVKTNGKFQSLLDNPASQPKELQEVLKGILKTDRTLLMLKAKGLRLKPGQNFLALSPDFKAGDAVQIEVAVEPIGSKKDVISVLGSPTDLPALQTSDGP